MLAGALGLLLALALLITLVAPTLANGPPPLPGQIYYHGNVYVDGNPPPAGTTITAWIGGFQVASCLVGDLVEGKRQYGYDPNPLLVDCTIGDTVTFRVGVQVDGTHNVTGYGAVYKDLIVGESPFTPTPTTTTTPTPTANVTPTITPTPTITDDNADDNADGNDNTDADGNADDNPDAFG